MPPIEHHVRVPRTARFYTVGTPGKQTKELWVACHGYGQLAAKFARWLEPLADDARVVVAPEALSRFYLDDPAKRHGPDSPVGATWMTREDREREIADYVEYLDVVTSTVQREMGDVPAPIVVALGFSQGVATVARWAALGRTQIQRLILWGGTPPSDLPADRGPQLFRGASLTFVAGRRDSIAPPAMVEREQAALSDRGLPSRVVLFDGGHFVQAETLRQLADEVSSGV